MVFFFPREYLSLKDKEGGFMRSGKGEEMFVGFCYLVNAVLSKAYSSSGRSSVPPESHTADLTSLT